MKVVAALNQQLVKGGLFGGRSPRRWMNAPGFRIRLENHLTDVKKGQPWRSDNVYQNLRARHAVNREVLAGVDNTAYKQYLGLMSGMTYAQQARLATTVHEMSRTISHFQRLDAIS